MTKNRRCEKMKKKLDVVEDDEYIKKILLREDAFKRVELLVWKNVDQIEFIITEKRWKRYRHFTLPLKKEEIAILKEILKLKED